MHIIHTYIHIHIHIHTDRHRLTSPRYGTSKDAAVGRAEWKGTLFSCRVLTSSGGVRGILCVCMHAWCVCCVCECVMHPVLMYAFMCTRYPASTTTHCGIYIHAYYVYVYARMYT